MNRRGDEHQGERDDAVVSAAAELVSGGTLSPRVGTVVSFDTERGLGVLSAQTGAAFGFHCTAIAGGARQIAVGRTVAFLLTAAPGGRFEATAVTPLPLG